MEEHRIAPLASLDEDFYDFSSESEELSDSTINDETAQLSSTGDTATSDRNHFTVDEFGTKVYSKDAVDAATNHVNDTADDVDALSAPVSSPRLLSGPEVQKKKATQYQVSGRWIGREFVQLVDEEDDDTSSGDSVQKDSNCLICEQEIEHTSPVHFDTVEAHAMVSSATLPRSRNKRDKYYVETAAIARPRSSTPISLATVADYTSLEPAERQPCSGQKLRITLPGDEFSDKLKSPRRSPRKNSMESIWTNFDEASLFSHSRSSITTAADVTCANAGGLLSPKKIILPSSPSPLATTKWVAFNYENNSGVGHS